MNASSLLPKAPASAPAASTPPTPEQIAAAAARRKALALAATKAELLRKVAATHTGLKAGAAAIKLLLDNNPQGLTRGEILASLSEEQATAFALVSGKTLELLALFEPPAPAAEPAPPAEPAPAEANAE